MRKLFIRFVNNWFDISVYMAGLVALLAIFLPLPLVQKMLLALTSVLFLHFFEEFGSPGGFPYMGVKLLLGSDEKDSSKWGANNLCSVYGNWLALLLMYVLPLCLPSIRVLTLSAMMFSLLELVMHTMFSIRLKQWYNPGLITAAFGLAPVAIYYFLTEFDASVFAWYDYVLAILWFAFVFWLCFRSPLYWYLGKKADYPFTEKSAFGLFEK